MAYEIEPNNSFVTATKVAFGVPVLGQISSSSDTDVFLYFVDGPCLINIDFSDPNANHLWGTNVSLFDAAGNELSGISGINAAKLSSYVANPGSYYVYLSKTITSGSQYSLSVNTSQVPEKSDYEIEPNDAFKTATKITLGKAVFGQISSSSDKDLFLLFVNGSGLINIDFSDPTAGHLWGTDVSFLDSAGNLIGRTSGTTAAQLSSYVANPGNYYVYLSKTVSSGSQYALSVTGQITEDISPPTVVVSSSKSNLNVGSTSNLSFILSESSTNFTASDITVTGGTLSNFSGSGTTYTATFTPISNSTSNGVVSVASGVFSDASGNVNVDGSDANNRVAISVDTVAPTVSITDNVAGVATTTTKTVAYSLVFNESVTGLDLTGLSVTNGAISSIVGSGANWTVNVTPAQQVAGGTISLTLKAGAVKDAAGNTNALTSHSAQTIDTSPPVAPKLIGSTSFNNVINPQITMQTSFGAVVLELYPGNAPATVANMLAYANSGFFDATTFHRVISGFMVQGGGFNTALAYKTPTYGPITLESDNGLSNVRGTIAMARTSDPNSANTQFFINQVDNTFLNYVNAASPGYAVFGKVISGLSVVDAIANVTSATYSTPIGTFQNVPVTEVVITSIKQTVAGSIYSNTATFSIGDLEAGAQWSFSLNGGLTWASGSGDKLTIPVGSYAVDAIQIRQTDAAGNLSAGVGKLTSSLVVGSAAPTGKAISGTTGNDLIVGTSGNDTIDGGSGIDTMTYNGTMTNYKVTQTAGSVTVTSNVDGVDNLVNVERLKFTDGKVALDLAINQPAGLSTVLLGAVLPGKLALESSKQALLGSVIGLIDSGYSVPVLAGALLRLDIWSILTGQSIPAASRTLVEDTAIVNYLLTNVYGTAPDTTTLKANADAMHSEASQGDWLAQLALSSAGQSHIGLVGLAATGLNYI